MLILYTENKVVNFATFLNSITFFQFKCIYVLDLDT